MVAPRLPLWYILPAGRLKGRGVAYLHNSPKIAGSLENFHAICRQLVDKAEVSIAYQDVVLSESEPISFGRPGR